MIRGQRRSARRLSLQVEQLEDRLVPALMGQQLFPADNPWNQRITDAPAAANSHAIIDHIIANYGNDRLHPDFTQNFGAHETLYGIPYNIVRGDSAAFINVVIDDYPGESDIVPAPIPDNAVLENDYQDGPRFGVENRGDSHLLIWDADNNIAYEFYHASRPEENADGRWHAAQQTVWDLNTNTFHTVGHTSADAAGLPILVGLTRPDEALPVDQGGQGVIDHAIRVTMEGDLILEKFLYPASHTANAGNVAADVLAPMGARFRLKHEVDITHLRPQSRIIAQALKDYGMIVADNGSNFFFSGASSSVDLDNQTTLTWDDSDIQDWDFGLMSLSFSDFEVVDLSPYVSSLDVHEGTAGTEVNVYGENFSGAAGRLQVLFGNVPATSVTIIDDGHLLVVAPQATGTVEVRVQSGVATSNALSYTPGVFGYGVSPAHNATLFTFPNDAPTIAESARAAPAVVTSYTTNLSVVAADDGGEAALNYSWSVVGKPAGAADPGFQSNDSNAAKNTSAVFFQTGVYILRATATDAAGLATFSDVTVTVAPTFTFIIIVPNTPRIVVNRSVRFFAYALDQYGFMLAQQPKFTWKLTGKGLLMANGRYIAPSFRGGPYTITARAGALKSSFTVRIVTSLPKTVRSALLP